MYGLLSPTDRDVPEPGRDLMEGGGPETLILDLDVLAAKRAWEYRRQRSGFR